MSRDHDGQSEPSDLPSALDSQDSQPIKQSPVKSVRFGDFVKRGEEPTKFLDSSKQALLAVLNVVDGSTDGDLVGDAVEAMEIEKEGKRLLSPRGFCLGLHPLIAASHYCFASHLPLVLSPDMIWLTIAQGLSRHINSDPEKFRYRFVEHEGQLQLDVRRDEFIRGSPSNDWPGVFKEFSGKIRDHIGAKTHDLLVPTFSTTTPVSAAAAEIVLLEAMKSYFKFHVFTLCGIPSFTVLGSADDWKSIRGRVLGFLKIDPDLSWWTDPLVAVLDHFILAAEGKADLAFWKSWYKHESQSGGELVSGAILALFPYKKEKMARNPFVDYRKVAAASSVGNSFHTVDGGMNMPQFPSSLAKAPFMWHYGGSDLKMVFISGLMAMVYDQEDGIKPVIGWGVLQKLNQ
eukprot:scpid103096/ scgid33771/ Uncharacterized protein L662